MLKRCDSPHLHEKHERSRNSAVAVVVAVAEEVVGILAARHSPALATHNRDLAADPDTLPPAAAEGVCYTLPAAAQATGSLLSAAALVAGEDIRAAVRSGRAAARGRRPARSTSARRGACR